MTVNFTAVYCPCGAEDTRRHRQARARRPRPRRQDHRPRAARRGHGGDLHRPPSDARADRRDGDPGGRRRGRDLDPLRRAHDARAADRRRACGRARPTTCSSSSAGRSPTTTRRSSMAAGVAAIFTPGAPTARDRRVPPLRRRRSRSAARAGAGARRVGAERLTSAELDVIDGERAGRARRHVERRLGRAREDDERDRPSGC